MLGRYELLEQIGSGGMAVVYRGRDTALDREVAVKLLHPHLAAAPESRARFSREARVVARLSHPGIVEIFDYAGDAAAESFLVTEFVRGRTLRAFAQEVGFGYPELGMLVGLALADALVHAHSAGVIHRDLKPENVLVDEGARPAVKLADFGIARVLASDERMTMTGALVGSPHHMPPEVVEGRDADVRSDVFSLGTMLYWLATGRLPFSAANPTAILRRVLQGDFEDPRKVDPRVSDALAELVVRCLQLAPERRPQSAAEVRDAVQQVLAEVGITRPQEALVAFLRDPARAKARFRTEASAALLARGDAAARAGAGARALRFYGRVLSIDPENADVAPRIARLRRRRLRRRAAMFGAAAVVLAVAAWLGVTEGARLLASRRTVAAATPVAAASTPAPPSPAARELTSPPLPASSDGPAPSVPPPDRGDPAPPDEAAPSVATGAPDAPAPAAGGSRAARPPRPAREGGARGPAGPVPLAVFVRPYAERALLDGVEVARGQQHVRFAIGPGVHTIQIEHACCVPFVKQLSAAEAQQAGELRVPLEPRPARLRIEGEPATRVVVNGKAFGTAGDSQRTPFAIPLPADAENPYEATARIGLEPPEGPPREIPVRLRAGVEVTVAAPETEVPP
ncbi:MAG TPA: serine/threonine-protein kinase [Anaeromyxobacter sp.]|nr:serine/threonine-protein kinase [Anaeromyxobacter sp.]